MRRVARWLVACAAFLSVTGALRADEQAVDVELVLAVDVSLSMMHEELEIQRAGYAAALSDPAVIDAMLGGLHGQVAITFVEWSGDGQHRIVVPWHLIASAEDARTVAEGIRSERPQGWRRTSISGAIGYSASLFEDNGFRSLKRIIDISGDGPNNDGGPVIAARDAAVERGIVINGLPLLTRMGFMSAFEIGDLDEYYRHCVIGGPGAFVMPVTAWEHFPETVRRKLVLELSGSLPAAIIRVAAGLATYDCLIGEKLWQQQRRILYGP